MGSLLSSGQNRAGPLSSGYSVAGDRPPTLFESVPEAAALARPVWEQVLQQPVDAARAYWEWRRRKGEDMAAAMRGLQRSATPQQRQLARHWVGNAAMGFMPGGLPNREAEAIAAGAVNVTSRSGGLYNPPAKPPRPFAADYPSGAQADATGNLTHTIDGDPITARWVVGRQMAGQPDVSFSQAELDALTKEGTGRLPALVPSREIKGDAGRTAIGATGRPLGVRLNRDLTSEQLPLVHAHENAHVINQIAGDVDKTGAVRQFREVYNDTNNPNVALRRAQHPDFDPRADGVGGAYRNYGPEQQGYPAREVPLELNAEAIRAYMADPNYLKTVAPKAAAAIRKAVNRDPELSRIIQFNSGGWAPFAVGGAATTYGPLGGRER